ncbi:ABC transporter ATP-binding protein [Paenibacillus hamazuiensis]|uniref:ABC transporter ATP-binding protein n=1 Tax=Paenibacillus hamazuiensis TaxID=2936508 RepID=UPI003B84A2BF
MTVRLEFQQLSKNLPRGQLFSGVSASVDRPETIALLGVSGQGKSTLLRMLALLDNVDGGELRLNGVSYSDWSPRQWRAQVCYVAQQPVMLPGSVRDNLMTVSRLHRRTFERELAERLMDRVGLSAIDWNKPAAELSGGEKQRVAIVRSMLLRSPILLLDEITASLDSHSKHAVGALLQEWHRSEGCTLIWVTHDLEEAQAMSRRVWFMAGGTLLEDRTTDEFFQHPATEQAEDYLQAAK